MSEPALELTAELLVDNAVPKLPAVFPDGSRVAYLVSEMGEKGRRYTELWLAETAAAGAPRRLVTGLPRTTALHWSADGSSLLYLAAGRLHRITVDTDGNALSAPSALTEWSGWIGDQVPLVDGRRVALIAADEESPEDERRAAEGDDAMVVGSGESPDRLWIFDLVDGTMNLLDGLRERHVVEVAQRPDGGALAVISWDCPAADPGAFTARLHSVDPDSGGALDLGAVGVDARSPVWWKAGDAWHLAYLAEPPGTLGPAAFDLVLPVDGRYVPAHHDLTSDLDVCPIALAQVAEGPPLALFADGLDTALYRLDPAGPRFRRTSVRPGRLEALTASSSGQVVAALGSAFPEPTDILAGSPEGELTRLSDTQPLLRRVRWGRRERRVYRAADGLEIEGLLVLPVGRTCADGPFPLITLVHGGPYARHADELALLEQPCSQWFAAAGFAVFLPNPRGSEGRGHAFAAAVQGRVGLEEWTDILSGIDLLVAEGVADESRLGISGWSHGGFMAAWAVGQTDRFGAALMGAGISDWGMQAATGELGAQEALLAGSNGWEGQGPHPHDRLSPLSYASAVRTPVLILHGEDDPNVPVGQAIAFHRALRAFDVEHELVIYPREGHGIWERRHQIDVLRRALAWFERHLSAAG